MSSAPAAPPPAPRRPTRPAARRPWLLPALLLGAGCAGHSPTGSPATTAADAGASPVEAPALLPRPRYARFFPDGFSLTARVPLLVTAPPAARAGADSVARWLQAWLRPALDAAPAVRFSADTARPGLHLILLPDAPAGAAALPDSLREAYHLRVTRDGIWLRARTGAGLFAGLQTLRQLLPVAAEQRLPGGPPRPDTAAVAAEPPLPRLRVPGALVRDWPRYRWRGLLLDVSRHFIDAPLLRRYLDLLALYKLNRLHLHLTDDQGWRLPSSRWPRLTSVGAWRVGADGRPYGGFYRPQEIRELVAYARARHIELMPEIDLPGHVRAALAAYPELSCTGRPLPVATDWGVHADVLCVGNPLVYAFAADVLGEALDLFPGRQLHLGGDECPTERWRQCPRCQALMQREGLRTERELQGYFLRRVQQVLAARGRQAVTWDEVLTQPQLPAPPTLLVQAWHGLAPVAAAVRAGYPALSSASSFAYLDQNTAILPLARVYQLRPTPAGLGPAEQALVWGGEAALWTERNAGTAAAVDAAVFPRLLALAEVFWRGPQPAESFPEFRGRMRQHYTRLARLGVQYGFEERPLTAATTATPAGLRVALTPGGPGLQLRYTTDGRPPDAAAALYAAPISCSRPTQLRVAAFRGAAALGELPALRVQPHAAAGVPVALAAPCHASYPAGGPGALTDGLLGSLDYRDGLWQGFERTDLTATLDLGRARLLDSVSIGFLQDWNSWIFLPSQVSFEFSTDGRSYSPPVPLRSVVPPAATEPLRRRYAVAGPAGGVRYVRVQAQNVGVCPPGHPGAGGAAFLMADEVLVRAHD